MLILIFIQSKSVWYINLENVVKIKDKSSGINFKRIKKKMVYNQNMFTVEGIDNKRGKKTHLFTLSYAFCLL